MTALMGKPENADDAPRVAADPDLLEAATVDDDGGGPWRRHNALRTILVLSLFGFCFASFPTLSILLTEFVKQGRLQLSDIGTAYMLLGLSQGVTCLFYGMKPKLEGNKKALFWCFIAIAAAFAAMGLVSGPALLALFALLGIPIGVVLSIATAGLVSFGVHAVRLQGFLSIGMRALQLATTAVFATLVVPHFSASGGFIVFAGIYLASAFIWPLFFVDRFSTVRAEAPLARGGMGRRGAVALAAALLIYGGRGAILPYVVPLGEFALGDPIRAREGMSVFVGGQLIGSIIVSVFPLGRKYLVMLTAGGAVILASAVGCAFSSSTPLFFLCLFTMACGLAVKDVFVLPMLISADPSRRAALQMSTASLFGETTAPLATAALLSTVGVISSLIVSSGMILAGLLIVYQLEFSKRRSIV